MGEPRATIDFETRSACPIRTHGSWRYSLDPTTEILCLAFRLPYWDKGRVELWHPAFPQLGMAEEGRAHLNMLFAWIHSGGLIEAHNAWFERGIWTNKGIPERGWPTIADHQWRCSAAKAAAHALPRDLDGAGSALGLTITKDLAGGKLMKKLAKPRKPRKKERETWAKMHGDAPMPILYHESEVWFRGLFAYCCQDVLAEEAVSEAVPDLNPFEQRVYLVDQTTNERGFCLDPDAISTALDLLEREQTDLNAELCELTGGVVPKATNRAKLSAWCAAQGTALPDTTAETVDQVLEYGHPSAPVYRALTILRTLGRSSTAKYEAMAKWICPDERAHGGLLYHAATTGRWGGQGIQPQNFPKGSIKDWDMEFGWEMLKSRDVDGLRAYFGSLTEPLAQALRGAIIATPGLSLYVADYASIEARVLLWLAEDEDGLEVFRQGKDIYCDMASAIYKRPIAKADAKERGMGKVAILGLGYQMGGPRFVDTCALWGITITEEFSKTVVDAYREKYWRVKELWGDQEHAAICATDNPFNEIKCGRVTWYSNKKYLYCQLPSGRRLAYPFPETRMTITSWGSRRPQLTFMGVNPLSHKWMRQHTYGGMIVENLVQAIARDLMAAAFVRCEDNGDFYPVLTIHDELVAEGIPGQSVKEFEALMTTLPIWATGCPVAAEGWTGERYKK
jgi:DNA polymerase